MHYYRINHIFTRVKTPVGCCRKKPIEFEGYITNKLRDSSTVNVLCYSNKVILSGDMSEPRKRKSFKTKVRIILKNITKTTCTVLVYLGGVLLCSFVGWLVWFNSVHNPNSMVQRPEPAVVMQTSPQTFTHCRPKVKPTFYYDSTVSPINGRDIEEQSQEMNPKETFSDEHCQFLNEFPKEKLEPFSIEEELKKMETKGSFNPFRGFSINLGIDGNTTFSSREMHLDQDIESLRNLRDRMIGQNPAIEEYWMRHPHKLTLAMLDASIMDLVLQKYHLNVKPHLTVSYQLTNHCTAYAKISPLTSETRFGANLTKGSQKGALEAHIEVINKMAPSSTGKQPLVFCEPNLGVSYSKGGRSVRVDVVVRNALEKRGLVPEVSVSFPFKKEPTLKPFMSGGMDTRTLALKHKTQRRYRPDLTPTTTRQKAEIAHHLAHHQPQPKLGEEPVVSNIKSQKNEKNKIVEQEKKKRELKRKAVTYRIIQGVKRLPSLTDVKSRSIKLADYNFILKENGLIYSIDNKPLSDNEQYAICELHDAYQPKTLIDVVCFYLRSILEVKFWRGQKLTQSETYFICNYNNTVKPRLEELNTEAKYEPVRQNVYQGFAKALGDPIPKKQATSFFGKVRNVFTSQKYQLSPNWELADPKMETDILWLNNIVEDDYYLLPLSDSPAN